MKNEINDCYSTNNNGYIIPINLDFDGTCVCHEFPKIGEENEYCIEVLKKWIEKYNVGLILHTSRDSVTIKPVLEWFKNRNICLWAIGKNPTQNKWTDSIKSYGFYIDDMCVGIPLISENGKRDRVDWKKIDEIFSPVLEKLSKER